MLPGEDIRNRVEDAYNKAHDNAKVARESAQEALGDCQSIKGAGYTGASCGSAMPEPPKCSHRTRVIQVPKPMTIMCNETVETYQLQLTKDEAQVLQKLLDHVMNEHSSPGVVKHIRAIQRAMNDCGVLRAHIRVTTDGHNGILLV